MTTYGKILSLNDYEEMKQVWIPNEGNQELFLVRIPDDLTTLTESKYQELMKLRLEWMMEDWLKTNPDRNELQQMLVQTLDQLNPVQEAPSQVDFEGEEKQIWAWAMGWGESLLEFNSTWMEWFQVSNPMIDFPVDLGQYQMPEAAIAQHNEATIEGFLTCLRAPFY